MNLREVRRQEAIHVEAVVGGKIDAHAVDRQRHLEAIEAADENISLGAGAAGVDRWRAGGRPDDAGQQVDGLTERLLIVSPHRLVGDRGPADHVELAERIDAGTGAGDAFARDLA
ncbi:MAG: hypothetical protein WDN31_08565 [Hyphomicrobium sp.]